MSYKIKELPEEERPREKAIQFGIENLSVVELLAILLQTGTKNLSVKELSVQLLDKVGGIKGLKDLRLSNLKRIKGIGNAKAITLLAAIELGKRMSFEPDKKKIQIKQTKDVYYYFAYLFRNETQEKFLVLFLDIKNYVLGKKIIFVGTASQSIVHPRDIFKEAVLNNASKIICIHNHPSGDVTPSIEDRNITLKLKEIADLMSIPLLDHVIIGKNSYYSFLESEW